MSEAEDDVGDDPLAATVASFPCTSLSIDVLQR
jgi:hypothetical protein